MTNQEAVIKEQLLLADIDRSIAQIYQRTSPIALVTLYDKMYSHMFNES